MTFEEADKYYRHCIEEWTEADRDCRRYFLLWETAKHRRELLAITKNNAWGDREMAKAEDAALSSHEPSPQETQP